jgi:uncharacterized membrane protein
MSAAPRFLEHSQTYSDAESRLLPIMKIIRIATRLGLGLALTFAGSSHLGFARETFRAQVPTWLPFDADFVVIASGIVEILLGLWLLSGFKAPIAGTATAVFFIAIFPGNISQWLTQTDAFGLNTDEARLIRLFFQPLLVIWALYSTSAIAWLKTMRSKK